MLNSSSNGDGPQQINEKMYYEKADVSKLTLEEKRMRGMNN